MRRQFCDKCGIDITDQTSGHVTGVDDADETGNGTVTDDADLCDVCYGTFRQWLDTPPGGDAIVRKQTHKKAKGQRSGGARKASGASAR